LSKYYLKLCNLLYTKYFNLITKPNWLVLFRETIAACKNRTKHINALYGHNAEVFLVVKRVVHKVTPCFKEVR
jgi:hypothetical protein